MDRSTSTFGRDASRRSLVWCAPKPSQIGRPHLVCGEIATPDMFFLLSFGPSCLVLSLFLCFCLFLFLVMYINILSFNGKTKKMVGDSPTDSVKKVLIT